MKLLFATDGSEYSERAAEFLRRFNFSEDDEIFIIHASSWVPIMSEWELTIPEIHEIRQEIVPKILESAEKILSPLKVKIQSIYEEDYPERAIIRKANELNVDLIVMGASGKRGFTARIVGSVTKSVAIKSERPVLIIRPSKREEKGLKILFATDGSVHSEAVVDLLDSLPLPEDSELILFSVLHTDYFGVPDYLSLEIDDRVKDIIVSLQEKENKESERIFESTEKRLRNKFKDIKRVVKSGDPPEEIIKASNEFGVDLVAVGSSGKKGFLGLIGSVSRHILHHAECSLLIAKHGK